MSIPTVPLEDLKTDRNYRVRGLVKMDSKDGSRIKVVLERHQKVFETLLPLELCQYLNEHDEAFREIHESNGKIFVRLDEPCQLEFIDYSAFL